MRRNKIIKNCKFCQKLFLTAPRHDFCSRNCVYDWGRENWTGYWTNKKRDPKTIEKIVRARKGKPLSETHKLKIAKGVTKGTTLTKYGYNVVVIKNKQYRVHRLIMEQKLGRKLKKEEIVHHIDHNRNNNHQDNLHLFGSKSEHQKFHENLKRAVKEGLECIGVKLS